MPLAEAERMASYESEREILHKAGDRVEITHWRGDQEHEVRVRLGEHPDEKGVAYLGIRFTSLFMKFFEKPED